MKNTRSTDSDGQERELRMLRDRCARLREAYLSLVALRSLDMNQPHTPAIGRYVQAKESLRRGDLGEAE